ncbi:hypothetical protein V491_02354 [Pseudogymnoascus sp. VKM F-3775]|nr:hypothetical protein V491_02354 [Pseudogymnoascus sp. VKM F-3775]
MGLRPLLMPYPVSYSTVRNYARTLKVSGSWCLKGLIPGARIKLEWQPEWRSRISPDPHPELAVGVAVKMTVEVAVELTARVAAGLAVGVAVEMTAGGEVDVAVEVTGL